MEMASLPTLLKIAHAFLSGAAVVQILKTPSPNRADCVRFAHNGVHVHTKFIVRKIKSAALKCCTGAIAMSGASFLDQTAAPHDVFIVILQFFSL